MKFTIVNIEKKMTSIGKEKADVSLTDEQGQVHQGVTIWGTFPGFQQLIPGSIVVGDVVSKQNGKYTNKTLYQERTNTLGGNPGAPAWAKSGGTGVKAAQERKEIMIEKAQERKNDSIAYFNAINSSIQLMGMYGNLKADSETDNVKKIIIYWRDWFLTEWSKYDAKPDESKRIPF